MLKNILKSTNAKELSSKELKQINGGHSHSTHCDYDGQDCTVFFDNIFGKYQEPGLCTFNGAGFVCIPQF